MRKNTELMNINGIQIDDTFAEAFNMRGDARDYHRAQLKMGVSRRQRHDRLCYQRDWLRC